MKLIYHTEGEISMHVCRLAERGRVDMLSW